ncbi:MAG: immunoglobulin-like domain-containing protein [Candidatus Izemoplasmataceae bacterium]
MKEIKMYLLGIFLLSIMVSCEQQGGDNSPNETNDVTKPEIELIQNEFEVYSEVDWNDIINIYDNVDSNPTNTIDTSDFDINVLGTYVINVVAQDASGNENSSDFIVHVTDTTPPTIKLNGEESITIFIGSDFIDPGVTIEDNYTMDLTPSVNSNVRFNYEGNYTITYSVGDSSGNGASIERSVIIMSPPHPTVEMEDDIYLFVGDDLPDLRENIFVTDYYNKDITSRVYVDSSNVIINQVGEYLVDYTVRDDYDNSLSFQRTVIVYDDIAPVVETNLYHFGDEVILPNLNLNRMWRNIATSDYTSSINLFDQLVEIKKSDGLIFNDDVFTISVPPDLNDGYYPKSTSTFDNYIFVVWTNDDETDQLYIYEMNGEDIEIIDSIVFTTNTEFKIKGYERNGILYLWGRNENEIIKISLIDDIESHHEILSIPDNYKFLDLKIIYNENMIISVMDYNTQYTEILVVSLEDGTVLNTIYPTANKEHSSFANDFGIFENFIICSSNVHVDDVRYAGGVFVYDLNTIEHSNEPEYILHYSEILSYSYFGNSLRVINNHMYLSAYIDSSFYVFDYLIEVADGNIMFTEIQDFKMPASYARPNFTNSVFFGDKYYALGTFLDVIVSDDTKVTIEVTSGEEVTTYTSNEVLLRNGRSYIIKVIDESGNTVTTNITFDNTEPKIVNYQQLYNNNEVAFTFSETVHKVLLDDLELNIASEGVDDIDIEDLLDGWHTIQMFDGHDNKSTSYEFFIDTTAPEITLYEYNLFDEVPYEYDLHKDEFGSIQKIIEKEKYTFVIRPEYERGVVFVYSFGERDFNMENALFILRNDIDYSEWEYYSPFGNNLDTYGDKVVITSTYGGIFLFDLSLEETNDAFFTVLKEDDGSKSYSFGQNIIFEDDIIMVSDRFRDYDNKNNAGCVFVYRISEETGAYYETIIWPSDQWYEIELSFGAGMDYDDGYLVVGSSKQYLSVFNLNLDETNPDFEKHIIITVPNNYADSYGYHVEIDGENITVIYTNWINYDNRERYYMKFNFLTFNDTQDFIQEYTLNDYMPELDYNTSSIVYKDGFLFVRYVSGSAILNLNIDPTDEEFITLLDIRYNDFTSNENKFILFQIGDKYLFNKPTNLVSISDEWTNFTYTITRNSEPYSLDNLEFWQEGTYVITAIDEAGNQSELTFTISNDVSE